jgi:hypothetical protein
MMRHLLGVFTIAVVVAGCVDGGMDTGVDAEDPGETDPAGSDGLPPVEVCTAESLSESAVAVVTEDPGSEDGPFALRISTAFDWCSLSGGWLGWGVDVTFLHGRPKPGEYSLADSELLDASGTYAESKVEGILTELDDAVLQISRIASDGTVEGALCGVELMTYGDPLPVQGRFTAVPCER